MQGLAKLLAIATFILSAACGDQPAPRGAVPLGESGGGAWAYQCAIPGDFVVADTVNITGGLLVPSCVFAPAGSSLRFVNHDSRPYSFVVESGGGAFEVPANGEVMTPPVGQGSAFTCTVLSNATVVVLVKSPF